jgi:hypothetical protein
MDIYIFRVEDQTTETLWDIVRDREQLSRDGSIGNCTLREVARKEAQGTHTVLNMELVASRAAYELLRRLEPSQFQ